MWKWIECFAGLLFPRCCVVCDGSLSRQEQFVCVGCLAGLPRTNFHYSADHPVEQIFRGQIPVVRGTSFFYYRKGSPYNRILYELKYNHCKQIGLVMGRNMASELIASGFFGGIDWIVPVPLHVKKEKIRGYNQSEWIARGVAAVTGIPVRTDLLIRKVNNPTQTRENVFEKWENVAGIFQLLSDENLSGKHLLLIDDVLTTGSTLLSASRTLCEGCDVKISVLTLAVTTHA